MTKTPAQTLLSGPVNPPPSSEAPSLPLPPHTSIVISEEAPSGWVTLYRGNIATTGIDARQLEEVMPMWLLECLLQNKVPSIPITKLSFVLLPYKEPDGEQLPELLNTCVHINASVILQQVVTSLLSQRAVQTHRKSIPTGTQADQSRMCPWHVHVCSVLIP